MADIDKSTRPEVAAKNEPLDRSHKKLYYGHDNHSEKHGISGQFVSNINQSQPAPPQSRQMITLLHLQGPPYLASHTPLGSNAQLYVPSLQHQEGQPSPQQAHQPLPTPNPTQVQLESVSAQGALAYSAPYQLPMAPSVYGYPMGYNSRYFNVGSYPQTQADMPEETLIRMSQHQHPHPQQQMQQSGLQLSNLQQAPNQGQAPKGLSIPTQIVPNLNQQTQGGVGQQHGDQSFLTESFPLAQYLPQRTNMNTFKISKPKKKPSSGSQPGARKSSKPKQSDSLEKPFACEFDGCEWAFSRQSDLRRHAKLHVAPMFHCPYWKNDPTCHRNGGAFNRLDVLKRHLKLVHYVQDKLQLIQDSKEDPGWCRSCQRMFPSSSYFIDHCVECAQVGTPVEWKDTNSKTNNSEEKHNQGEAEYNSDVRFVNRIGVPAISPASTIQRLEPAVESGSTTLPADRILNSVSTGLKKVEDARIAPNRKAVLANIGIVEGSKSTGTSVPGNHESTSDLNNES